ncbi:MAG: hypothetical protein GX208_03480 [Firmicutes bacterium]|nr:hypothetical protein [Bacillota bacterium]
MKDCCLILDGYALTYRAFFGVPDRIRTVKGKAINAVLGFYNTLSSLINQIHPDYLVVAFDLPQPTFRHLMYGQYKANRPPMPEDLKYQIPIIRQLLAAFKIPILELPGYEADDIVGTLTRCLPSDDTEAYIVTTDRDSLQLVNEQVSVLVPNSKENKIYTPPVVEHEWKVKPALIPDLKALMGDSSDNIPGIPLVGPKTAVKWLEKYGSLEEVLANAEQLPGKAGKNLRNNIDNAKLYKELATIKVNVPITWCWKSLKLVDDFSEVKDVLDEIGIMAKLPNTV